MKIRNPFSRRGVVPTEPHAFVATLDEGMSQAASGGGFRTTSQANMLAVTMRSVPSARCLLAGCGRDRDDPIHILAR